MRLYFPALALIAVIAISPASAQDASVVTVFDAKGRRERVIDSEQIRHVASKPTSLVINGDTGGGKTLAEIFAESVPDAERFSIISAARAVDPQQNGVATFFFEYVETDQIRPFE